MHTCVVALVSVMLIAGGSRSAPPSPTVRVVYVIPSDRKPWPLFQEGLTRWLQDAQWYFACQMNAHGHGWRTFQYSKTADGQAEFKMVRVEATMQEMMKSLKDTMRTSRTGLAKVLQDLPERERESWKHSVIIIFRENLEMKADGTLFWGATRGGGGRVFLSTVHLRVGLPEWFGCDDPYAGKVMKELSDATEQGHGQAELLRQPLKQGAFPQHAGRTLGRISSDAYGAMIHELGHAFGLPHTGHLPGIPAPQKEKKFKWAGWLMVSHGRIAGNLNEGVRNMVAGITKEEADVLARGPFLTRKLTEQELQSLPSTEASPIVGARRPMVGPDGNIITGADGRVLIFGLDEVPGPAEPLRVDTQPFVFVDGLRLATVREGEQFLSNRPHKIIAFPQELDGALLLLRSREDSWTWLEPGKVSFQRDGWLYMAAMWEYIGQVKVTGKQFDILRRAGWKDVEGEFSTTTTKGQEVWRWRVMKKRIGRGTVQVQNEGNIKDAMLVFMFAE